MPEDKDLTAQAMARSMGYNLADDTDSDQDQQKTDDQQADDQKTDQNQVDDKTDNTDQTDTQDDQSQSSDDDQKVDDQKVDPDQVDDQKVIPTEDNSANDQAPEVDFSALLTEQSGGRFTSMADIDKALEDAPATAFANEQVAKLNEYVKAGGKLEDFVKTQTVDYSKMDAFELIKAHRSLGSSDLTPDEIELLIEDEFGFPKDASERQKKLAAVKLKAAGAEAYKALVENQRKWATPMVDQNKQREAAAEKWGQQLNGAVDKVTEIQLALNQNETFTYKVEDGVKDKVRANYKDLGQFFKRYVNADGSEDTERFVRDMILLENYETIVRAAAAHNKSEGKKEVVKDIKQTNFESKSKTDQQDGPKTIQQQAWEHFRMG